ncbi:hypothetical protein DFH07DRAFT_965729 [Mycena maculata]|uniref:Uncharacterized protein n=1 Tax=Mycena maculata TaxID=230809 RepID=A0AAD7MZM9_9AGAR|nr:hypothetical protein DFH07DRAFT_965726 [Mycena maculata]KAJ7739445.1 hypothetical protein DFH07DRAFT_965729 [Mycena maculata]
MATNIPGSLSKDDELIVRKLLKTVRATKYEDPVDQEAFLVESATTVLQFRPQVASFAQVADLADCVFILRSMMHASRARLGTPPNATFVSLQDFAGEIVRKRHIFRERQRANAEQARTRETTVARAERSDALEHAAKKVPASPDKDAVSIPSSSDDGMAPLDLQLVSKARLIPPSSPAPLFISQGIFSFPYLRLAFSLLITVDPSLSAAPPKLSLVIKPIPSGPRAGLLPRSTPPSHKRKRLEEGEGGTGRSPIETAIYTRPRRPVQHPSNGSSPIRPSAVQLHRRLVAVQAEIRRFVAVQKELSWQLQKPHSFKLQILAMVWFIILFQFFQRLFGYIQQLLDVGSPDSPIELTHNRSRFLPLNEPSSTVFLTSTMSPGPKSIIFGAFDFNCFHAIPHFLNMDGMLGQCTSTKSN